ncbi:hypothetical protein D8I24_3037 (plasmid) [Cupriavidus necator H850]|uniref:hypothetical protein n=1 Tax=Cupriavidus necator TaxID=106590 RepID=UPI003FA484B8|nr:hypothetical protein D8I24_3037 [Cupriavidus necator H850]
MAWDTGVYEADVKRFLRKSAVYLFHLRRLPAIAHRRFPRPAWLEAHRAARVERSHGRRPLAVL